MVAQQRFYIILGICSLSVITIHEYLGPRLVRSQNTWKNLAQLSGVPNYTRVELNGARVDPAFRVVLVVL